MRFVSKYPKLGLGTAQTERFLLALDGQRDQTAESLPVQFSQDGLLSSDIRFALEHWRESEFTGRWLDADGVTQQPVGERIGMFETTEHGWDDESREKVEKWMLAKANFGLDFILVERVAGGPPWPTYDQTHHFKIPGLAAELGLLEDALNYELATKNRDSVVTGLEGELAKIAEVPAEGELVSA